MYERELQKAYKRHMRVLDIEIVIDIVLFITFVTLIVLYTTNTGERRLYLSWLTIVWCFWVFLDKFVFDSLKTKAKARVKQLECARERGGDKG